MNAAQGLFDQGLLEQGSIEHADVGDDAGADAELAETLFHLCVCALAMLVAATLFLP